MIRVQSLTKRFGPHVAVADVSFEIGRGEVVGFLGPNGAGKTTTIRVLTGYHPATSGTAEVAGFDVATHSLDVRRNIGYLPQEVPIYPELRVVEYLRFRAELKGVPHRERRSAVERAMERADIADVARKRVGHVSHGYRQRVGLADALVSKPPILILDEPTSGLDPNQRRRVKQVVRDLASDHTVLFSSHILGEVQDVSSRILVIHRGRVRADGAPGELVAAHTKAQLVVAARCPAAVLREAVAEASGLLLDAFECVGQDGVARCRAPLAVGADPREEVGARLLAAQVPVLELQIEMPTLEEFFYQITDGSEFEAASAAAAEVAP